MLWLRVLSAIIGIPVLIWIIYQGGFSLAIALFVLIIIGTWEFINMLRQKGWEPLTLPVILGEFVFILGAWQNWEQWASLGFGLCFLVLIITVFIKFPQVNLVNVSMSLLILMYVGWPLTHLLLIRNSSRGYLFLLFLFLLIWTTDTGAYFSGRFFGKKKLAPQISPNKTIEGALGGLLLSLVFALIFNNYFKIFSWPVIIYLSLIISVMGQIGDLLESAFKRVLGVKDSGNIIPGHGGVLDRFDSTITTAPVLFYLMILLDKMG